MAGQIEIRRLASTALDEQLDALAGGLVDCVAGGASVSYLAPFWHEQARSAFEPLTPRSSRVGGCFSPPFANGDLVGTVELLARVRSCTPTNLFGGVEERRFVRSQHLTPSRGSGQLVEDSCRVGRGGQLWVVRRDEFAVEPAFSLGASGHGRDRVAPEVAADIATGTADKGTGKAIEGPCETNRLGKGREGLVPQPRHVAEPFCLRDPALRRQQRDRDWDSPTIAMLSGRSLRGVIELLGQKIKRRLTVAGHERVDVDDQPDPLGDPLGGARDGYAPVAMTAENDVVKVLQFEDRHNVLHVGGHPNLGPPKVRALSQASQGWRENLMTTVAQRLGDRRPLPATAPAAMHDNERRDPHILSRREAP